MEPRKNLVLFTGTSHHKMREAVSKWIGLFESKYGAGNSVRIEAGKFPPEMVSTELLSPPFFVEKRLVVFEGLPSAKAKKSDRGEDSDGAPKDGAAEKIEAAVLDSWNAIPESTVAVFVSPDADTKSKLFVRLSEEGTVRRFDAWDTDGAAKYVMDRLPNIDVPGRRILVERTYGNDALLSDAVERLSLAFGDAKIGKTEAEEALPAVAETDVFEFSAAIASFDAVRALTLLASASERESPRKLLPIVVGEIRKTLYVDVLRKSGFQKGEIAGILGMKSSWGVDKRPPLSDAAYERVFKLYERLVEFDAAWKTGTAAGGDDAEMFGNGMLRAMLGGAQENSR